MQRLFVSLVIAGGLLTATSVRADTVTMHMNSDAGSVVQFNPNGGIGSGSPPTFSFGTVNGSGTFSAGAASFTVDLLNGSALPSGLSINGTVAGTFGITSINNSDLQNQTGTVNSSDIGKLTLTDNKGNTLTADIFFTKVFSNGEDGDGQGRATAGGNLNVTNVVYTHGDGGADTYLQTLADNSSAQLNAFFDWLPGDFHDLTQLTSQTSPPTTFELTLKDPVAPAPASWAMLMSGASLVSGLGFFRRRRWLALA